MALSQATGKGQIIATSVGPLPSGLNDFLTIFPFPSLPGTSEFRLPAVQDLSRILALKAIGVTYVPALVALLFVLAEQHGLIIRKSKGKASIVSEIAVDCTKKQVLDEIFAFSEVIATVVAVNVAT